MRFYQIKPPNVWKKLNQLVNPKATTYDRNNIWCFWQFKTYFHMILISTHKNSKDLCFEEVSHVKE
jgi:hypothetical protein